MFASKSLKNKANSGVLTSRGLLKPPVFGTLFTLNLAHLGDPYVPVPNFYSPFGDEMLNGSLESSLRRTFPACADTAQACPFTPILNQGNLRVARNVLTLGSKNSLL
jgi:hypothetical protein